MDGCLFNTDKTQLLVVPDACTRAEGRYQMPEEIEQIDEAAFNDCSKLTEIYIPDGVKLPGKFWLDHCSSLTSLCLPDSISEIGGLVLSEYPDLKKIRIPPQSIKIDDYAFSSCEKVAIYGARGSYAESFACRRGIPFEEEQNF